MASINFDINYAESRLIQTAENYERRGFKFLANFTRTVNYDFIDQYLKAKLNHFPHNATIHNNFDLENALSIAKILDFLVSVMTNPSALSDALKIDILKNIHNYRSFPEQAQTEKGDKLNSLLLEIVEKEQNITIPFEKANEEIDKLYFEMKKIDFMVYTDPHGFKFEIIKILRKNVHELHNAALQKKFDDATDKLSRIYDEMNIYVPINNIEKLNKIIEMIPKYMAANDVMEGILDSEHLDCSFFRCRVVNHGK